MATSTTTRKKASKRTTKKAPARRTRAAKPATVKEADNAGRALAALMTTGKRRSERLDAIQPNDWNPNEVPPHKMEAIKRSMLEDGWLESQPILVWETDERGRKKMFIIDGEHRWKCGIEVGFKKAPMVFLNNITREQAQALTIKLDHLRGKFGEQSLANVLRDLLPKLDVEDPAAALGFTQPEVNKMLALPPIALDGGNRGSEGGEGGGRIGSDTTSQNVLTKMVPVYMKQEEHGGFTKMVKQVADKHDELETVSDVVLFVLREHVKGME